MFKLLDYPGIRIAGMAALALGLTAPAVAGVDADPGKAPVEAARPDEPTAAQPAQDHNSSRSNKSAAAAPAQDHNSSRSNKTASAQPAQDHNSSRSNKTADDAGD
jgi:hypothetical protein